MPNVYEVITDRIVKQLEAGVAPWHKPWKERGRAALPRNLVTGREYRGINVWILMSSGFGSPYWLTFKQALELGGHVRKGQAGLPVVYWKFGTRELQDGDEVIERPFVLCRYYTVFNLEQCDGIPVPAPQPVAADQVKPIQVCEQVVTDWKTTPLIVHGGDRASHSKIEDRIRMPKPEDFDCAEEYYATLFHEMAHSTGHPSRLNRSTLMDAEFFGDQIYSREELVAEMGAAFLCGFTGIENRTVDNSSAYLQSWLEALKSDSRLVMVAAGQAQRAVDYVLGSASQSDDNRKTLSR